MFPTVGTPNAAVMDSLRALAERLPDWEGKSGIERLGFAMTRPSEMSLQALNLFLPLNTNNVGLQTDKPNISGTRQLEKEAILQLASLLGGRPDEVEGYITSGATEGTIYGCWLGREYLGSPTVLMTEFTHSSARKAARLLGLKTQLIETNSDDFTIDVDKLSSLIQETDEAYIIIATAGYYSTGMVDNIAELAALKKRYGRRLYLHIDAAIGGYVLPFSSPDIVFDFRLAGVDSMSIDPHKNGLLPYSCGVVLFRTKYLGLMDLTNDLAKVHDETLIGSRPGAVAAALWATHVNLGYDGYKHVVNECLKVKELCMRKLQEQGEVEIIHHPAMNHFAVHFSDRTITPLLLEKYRLVINPLRVHGTLKDFIHFYIMPHVTARTVDRFMQDLSVIPLKTI